MMRRKEGKNNFRQVRTISWYQKKTSIDQMSSVWAVWDFWQPYNVKSLSSSKTSRQQLQAASITSHEPVSSVSSKNIKASYPVLLEHLRERGRDEEKQASHSSGKNPKYLIIKAKRATETEADSLWVSGLLLTNCELTDWGLCQHSEKRWWMMRRGPRDTTGQQLSDALYSSWFKLGLEFQKQKFKCKAGLKILVSFSWHIRTGKLSMHSPHEV